LSEESILESLKRKWDGWEESIMIRRQAYLAAKEHMKSAEEEYRLSRSVFHRTYKDWKEARAEAERAKRRFKSYPYRIRQWAKNNFGKVWELLEHANEDDKRGKG
jgi:hypothetical protein